MALSQIRFCKKFLGSLFFGDAVDTDIHEEPKNKLTTQIDYRFVTRTNKKQKNLRVKFEAKDRICDSAIIDFCAAKMIRG